MFSIRIIVLFALLATSRAHMVLPVDNGATTTTTTDGELATPSGAHKLPAGAVVNAVAADLPVPTAPIRAKSAQNNDFIFDLAKDLPAVKFTSTPLEQVPQICAQYTVPSSSSPAECPVGNAMTAINVQFEDCGSQFTICRCDNSTTMRMDQAVSSFAKVPVGLRRYVNTVMLFPDSSPHAYTLSTGDIHMFANLDLNTWIHEATHAMDYGTPSTPLSSSEGWLQALKDDSCVPDAYSQTNAIEDFAQMGVLKMYALAHNGQLPAAFDNQCMKNQLAYMDSLPIYDAKKMFGNTCDFDATAQRGGILVGSGAKHQQPPATLDTSLVSPFKSSNTTAASGFKKIPTNTGGASPTAVAAGTDPNSKSSAVSLPTNLVRSVGVSGIVIAFSFFLL